MDTPELVDDKMSLYQNWYIAVFFWLKTLKNQLQCGKRFQTHLSDLFFFSNLLGLFQKKKWLVSFLVTTHKISTHEI